MQLRLRHLRGWSGIARFYIRRLKWEARCKWKSFSIFFTSSCAVFKHMWFEIYFLLLTGYFSEANVWKSLYFIKVTYFSVFFSVTRVYISLDSARLVRIIKFLLYFTNRLFFNSNIIYQCLYVNFKLQYKY